MLTNCAGELPNPHRNSVREVLHALVCQDNELRRLNIEIRNLQNELKEEIDAIEIRCGEVRNRPGSSQAPEFTRYIATVDEMNECFAKRIGAIQKTREEVLASAHKCALELHQRKCRFKNFHEKTVEYLKRLAIKSNDQKVVKNCEKDVCEMQKLFIKEVAFITKCETDLQPLFRHVQASDCQVLCNCCCFKEYEWIPPGKNLQAVNDRACEIKKIMGPYLRRAFGQLYTRQPADPKSFLAAYLVHMEQNEGAVLEKLQAMRKEFGLSPI